MKTSLRLLAVTALSSLTLSSCVVDPYGYPVGGFPPGAGGYSSVAYYDSTPYGYGYSPLYTPVTSSFSFFGGNGWGWGRNNCYRPGYSTSGHHHHSSHSRYSPRIHSASSRYAAQVTQPSSFRGSSLFSAPPSTPSLPSPRTLSRPTLRSSPAPSPVFPNLERSSPVRSFEAPSLPRPSGRSERPSPGVASFSTPPPAPSRSALTSMSAPAAPSGRFESLPSDRRRER